MPSRGEMAGQDFNTVTFGSRPGGGGTNAASVKQAQRSGVAVDTSRRTGVGNSNIASTGLSAAKLDNETEELKREHARTRDHTRTRAPLTRTRAPPPRAHASTRTNTYGHIRTSAHTCTRARTREGLVHEAR